LIRGQWKEKSFLVLGSRWQKPPLPVTYMNHHRITNKLLTGFKGPLHIDRFSSLEYWTTSHCEISYLGSLASSGGASARIKRGLNMSSI
jgi:hypothetical protein